MKRRTKDEYDNVMKLISENKSIKEISLMTGISTETIRKWKNGKIQNKTKKSEFYEKLEKLSDIELQNIINNSTSISSIIFSLGKSGCCKFYRDILNTRLNKYEFDFSKMKENFKEDAKKKHGRGCVFDVNSPTQRKDIKKYLLDNNILKNECSICGKLPFVNNKVLVLQLDHINGINNDNRLVNLRILCPDCHTQQDTSSGKNIKQKKQNTTTVSKKIISLCGCGNIKRKKSLFCIKCHSKNRPRKFEITKEELEQLVKEKPMIEIGKIFGVSDNAVKKRCKKLGIELKPMLGYWTKKKYGKLTE